MSLFPSLISAGSAIAGGLLGRRSAESAGNKNADLQREFAKTGIQWKVADAKKAGVHPLFALGANTHSASPAYVGDTALPNALSSAGQDVSRAMYATSDANTRQVAKMSALQVENQGLQNDLLRAQIAKLNGQVGPPMPDGSAQAFPIRSDGIVTRDLVQVKPSEVISARSEDPSTEAGPAGPGFKEYDLGETLGKWRLPAGQVSESLDDMEIAKYALMAAANHEKLGYLKNVVPNLAWQMFNKPDWVKDVEKRYNQVLLPFYRSDGKLYWKGINRK